MSQLYDKTLPSLESLGHASQKIWISQAAFYTHWTKISTNKEALPFVITLYDSRQEYHQGSKK